MIKMTEVNRNIAFDVARALGIILVVFGHALRGLVSGGHVDPTGWSHSVDYFIYTFHMPLFFVVSGYFFRTGGGDTFASKILWNLAYPYILWTLIQGSVQILLANSGSVNGSLTIADLSQILWKPIGQFWFLYAMFFVQIIAFLSRNHCKNLSATIMAFIGFLVSFFFLPGTFTLVFYGLAYFLLGIYFHDQNIFEKVRSSASRVAILLAGGIAAAILCYKLGVPEKMPIAAALLLVPGLIGLCYALSGAIKGTILAKGLVLIGQSSMGIYILHILTIGVVRIVLLRVFNVTDPFVLLTSLTVIAVLVPVALQQVAVRLGIEKYLGLPSSANPMRARPRVET